MENRPDTGASKCSDGEKSRRRGESRRRNPGSLRRAGLRWREQLSRRRRKSSSRGKATEAMRHDADEDAGATTTKCEITGNASHDGEPEPSGSPGTARSTMRSAGVPPHHRFSAVCPARHPNSLPVVPASPPLSLSLVPPLLSGLWPPSPPSPRPEGVPSSRGAFFVRDYRKCSRFCPVSPRSRSRFSPPNPPVSRALAPRGDFC